MLGFTVVPAVKFEILLPMTYVDPADPARTQQYVQLAEVGRYLDSLTAKYALTVGIRSLIPLLPHHFREDIKAVLKNEISGR